MARKEHTFRGKTVAELKELSIDEFAELLPSRERRTYKRSFGEEERKILEKLDKKGKVRTHLREMIVFPQMVDKTVSVHNGKDFVDVIIQPESIGMRLGQLVLTRRMVKHGGPGVGASKSSSSVSVR